MDTAQNICLWRLFQYRVWWPQQLMLQAKVSAPTRAGRALRRSLLKGCVVVIVVAGYSGKRFVYERAHELGIRCSARSSCLPNASA